MEKSLAMTGLILTVIALIILGALYVFATSYDEQPQTASAGAMANAVYYMHDDAQGQQRLFIPYDERADALTIRNEYFAPENRINHVDPDYKTYLRENNVRACPG